jgi:hypothetical protein
LAVLAIGIYKLFAEMTENVEEGATAPPDAVIAHAIMNALREIQKPSN